MRKRLALGAFLLFVSLPALAQRPVQALRGAPKVELYSGYAYTRFNAFGQGSNRNGVYGSAAWNVNSWLQIVGDLSADRALASGIKTVIYGDHFGPRIFYRKPNAWGTTPFVEALFGVSRLDTTVNVPGGSHSSEHGFSMKAGGGLDLNISPHFAIRLFDADYYRTSFLNSHQNNLWFSSGIVLRLGGGRPR